MMLADVCWEDVFQFFYSLMEHVANFKNTHHFCEIQIKFKFHNKKKT